MRISLYSGSTLYPLAGQSGVSERTHSSAGDLVISPQAEVQVSAFVRGAYARPLDRGNVLNVISFSTTRKFASPAEAQQWALDYDADFPRSGTLYLDTVSPLGLIVRRVMANAVVDPPRRRLAGATVLLDYSVRGGAISVDIPAVDEISVTGTLTSNGTTSVTFPALLYAGIANTKPVFSDTGDFSGAKVLFWDVSVTPHRWSLSQISPAANWFSSSDTATPDLASGWTAESPATGTPTVAAV